MHEVTTFDISWHSWARSRLIQMNIQTKSVWKTLSFWWKPPETQPCRETRCLNIANHFYKHQLCQSMSWWHHYCEEKSSTSTWWIVIIIISMLNLRHPRRSHGHPRWPSQESWLKSQIKLNKAWTKSLNFPVHIKCGWHIKIRHKSNFERKSFKKIVISQVSTISHLLEFLFKNVVWLLEVLVRWFLTLLPLWQVHGTGSLPPLFLRCI